VTEAVKAFDVSERRACSALCVARSSQRYSSRRSDCAALKLRLRELALTRPRFGYVRLHVLLRREGWLVNRKKIYRLYREMGLLVRTKRRRKFASHLRTIPAVATRTNERWTMDFVSDTTIDGRSIRVLTVVDTYSATLDRVIAGRGEPQMITCDNGTEFTSNHFDAWACQQKIAIDFIQPGRPVQNGHIESFNGKLRDECLNTSWFTDLHDAKQAIESWRMDYNEVRLHSRLGQLPPGRDVRRRRKLLQSAIPGPRIHARSGPRLGAGSPVDHAPVRLTREQLARDGGSSDVATARLNLCEGATPARRCAQAAGSGWTDVGEEC
jgi:putative transposase